jgi:hypothetical protein
MTPPSHRTRLACPPRWFRRGKRSAIGAMAQARNSRSWRTVTVSRWRRSGLTAADFASREGFRFRLFASGRAVWGVVSVRSTGPQSSRSRSLCRRGDGLFDRGVGSRRSHPMRAGRRRHVHRGARARAQRSVSGCSRFEPSRARPTNTSRSLRASRARASEARLLLRPIDRDRARAT